MADVTAQNPAEAPEADRPPIVTDEAFGAHLRGLMAERDRASAAYRAATEAVEAAERQREDLFIEWTKARKALAEAVAPGEFL